MQSICAMRPLLIIGKQPSHIPARQESLCVSQPHNETVAHVHSSAAVLLKQLLRLQQGSNKRYWVCKSCPERVMSGLDLDCQTASVKRAA